MQNECTEKKILWRIFGPKQEENEDWRKYYIFAISYITVRIINLKDGDGQDI